MSLELHLTRILAWAKVVSLILVETNLMNMPTLIIIFGCCYFHFSSWYAWFLYFHFCLVSFSLLPFSTLPMCAFFFFFFSYIDFQWSLLLVKKKNYLPPVWENIVINFGHGSFLQLKNRAKGRKNQSNFCGIIDITINSFRKRWYLKSNVVFKPYKFDLVLLLLFLLVSYTQTKWVLNPQPHSLSTLVRRGTAIWAKAH